MAAACTFRLFAGPTELNVVDQMVTMRGFKKTNGGLKTFGGAITLNYCYR
jgi:hypothetical protein